MDTIDFKRQADLIYQAIPQLAELTGDELERFAAELLLDLAKIGLRCGYADGELDTRESELAEQVFSRILQGRENRPPLRVVGPIAVRPVEGGPRRSADEQGRLSDSTRRIFDRARREGLDRLTVPGLARDYDRHHGSNSFDRIAHAMYRFASYLIKADGTVTPEETEALKQVWRRVHRRPREAAPRRQARPAVVLPFPDGGRGREDDPLAEIDSLVGLAEVKERLRSLANLLEVQRTRARRGLTASPPALHGVFYGPPGTGKVKAARLLGRICRHHGALDSGHVVEVEAASLLAGGEGARHRIDEAVAAAAGGVLLIRGAHRLAPEGSEAAQEALVALLAALDGPAGPRHGEAAPAGRHRLVLILSGYREELERLLEARLELRRRLAHIYRFEELAVAELAEVFQRLATAAGYTLSAAALSRLHDLLTALDPGSGVGHRNIGLATSLFRRAIERHADRIAGIAPLDDDLLTTLEDIDLPPASFDPAVGREPS